MKCSIIRDLLPHYVEAECRPESEKLVEQHLSTCHGCQELLAELRSEQTVVPLPVPALLSEEAAQTDRHVWRKYFGRMIVKGTLLFFAVYMILLMLFHAGK